MTDDWTGHQAGSTDYLDTADWGDGFGDGHHPSLCSDRCPCKQMGGPA